MTITPNISTPNAQSADVLRGLKLFITDVDGVLTNGSIEYDDTGNETKTFHVRDGLALKLLRDMGWRTAVLTGRASPCVTLRVRELKVDFFLSGVDNKGQGLEDICAMADVEPSEVAYVGDDLIDLPAMTRCGYPIAVADASPEVRQVAQHVTAARGGNAAVREAAEHLLKAQQRWDEALERFLT